MTTSKWVELMLQYRCPQCGARRGRPCVTVTHSHRTDRKRGPLGVPTYPHRERRKAMLEDLESGALHVREDGAAE